MVIYGDKREIIRSYEFMSALTRTYTNNDEAKSNSKPSQAEPATK